MQFACPNGLQADSLDGKWVDPKGTIEGSNPKFRILACTCTSLLSNNGNTKDCPKMATKDGNIPKLFEGYFLSCSSDPNSKSQRDKVKDRFMIFQTLRTERVANLVSYERLAGLGEAAAVQMSTRNIILLVDTALRKAINVARSSMCIDHNFRGGNDRLGSTRIGRLHGSSGMTRKSSRHLLDEGTDFLDLDSTSHLGEGQLLGGNEMSQLGASSSAGGRRRRRSRRRSSSRRRAPTPAATPHQSAPGGSTTAAKLDYLVNEIISQTPANYQDAWGEIGSTVISKWNDNMRAENLHVLSASESGSKQIEQDDGSMKKYQRLVYSVKYGDTVVNAQTSGYQAYLVRTEKDCNTAEFMRSAVSMEKVAGGRRGGGGVLSTTGSFTLSSGGGTA
jgi:hypothetical protein